ncbi:MAG: DUF4760 domain-containing protein [Proteobacteria bacterium]|nr:DUF4760 domain-containing protein [Pseudomonadota bacterium]
MSWSSVASLLVANIAGQIPKSNEMQVKNVDPFAMEPSDYVLIAAVILATIGWIITVIINRSLSRKQHTFNALLEMSFHDKLESCIANLSPHLRSGKLPSPIGPIEKDLKLLLNHYEFLAAAIRNGIVNEKLLADSDKPLVVRLVETSKIYIKSERSKSVRKTEDEKNKMYEHIVWLFRRWTDAQPCPPQKLIEFFWGRPIFPTKSSIRLHLNRN